MGMEAPEKETMLPDWGRAGRDGGGGDGARQLSYRPMVNKCQELAWKHIMIGVVLFCLKC